MENFKPAIIGHEEFTAPSIDVFTPQDPSEAARLRDVEEYTAAYHVHYMEGVEGHQLNPEGAEHNLDQLVVLTKAIRERILVDKRFKAFPEEIGWFREKYPNSDLSPEKMMKPASVVRSWLMKLGPHNDMADAEGALMMARDWVIEESQGAEADAGLIADIDLELADLLDGEARTAYLDEAVQYLEKQSIAQIGSDDLGKAALTQAKITAIKLELKRHEVTGTRFLAGTVDVEAYRELENEALAGLEVLDDYIDSGLENLADRFNSFATDEDAEGDSDGIKNLGVIFEAATYSSILSEMISSGKLALGRINIGTQRQESGLAHKIFKPGERRKQPDGFNFNYDLEYSEMNPDDANGILSTVYVQNKLVLSPRYSQEKADSASEAFFAGKRFLYFSAKDLDVDAIDPSFGLRAEVAHITSGLQEHLDLMHQRRTARIISDE